MSTLEALLAISIFVLIVSFFVAGLSSILDNRVLSVSRDRLREKSRLISEFIALYLETNPLIFESDKNSIASKLEDAVRKYSYEHKLVLDSKDQVYQTQVRISFPTLLIKDEQGFFRVAPSVTYYVVLILEPSGGAYITKSSGPLLPSSDRFIVATPGSVYVIGYQYSEIDYITQDNLPCRIIYFSNENICVGFLSKTNEKSYHFSTSCILTLQGGYEITEVEKIRDAIRFLTAKGLVSPPYALICGSKYYVYPPLNEPLVLFRSDIPKAVICESSYALAVIDGFIVVVETVVWG
ncbi:MAG: hypothetical protein QXM43_00275 [Desulfurococcaceae archaeon]